VISRFHQRAWIALLSIAACAEPGGRAETAQRQGDGHPDSDIEPRVDKTGPEFVASRTKGEESQRPGDAKSSLLTVDVTPYLRGSWRRVLRDGDTLESGDRIHVEVKTTVPAHVYLVYCDRDEKLTVFPSEASVETRAGEITLLPAANASIVLDDTPGQEVLYVIASRTKLAAAEPALADVVARSRPAKTSPDCGKAFRAAVKGRPGVKKPVVRGNRDQGGADGGERIPPPATIERGAYLEWDDGAVVNAGADFHGIVILRYKFEHVSRRPSSRRQPAP
jgi:hypothetical protein